MPSGRLEKGQEKNDGTVRHDWVWQAHRQLNFQMSVLKYLTLPTFRASNGVACRMRDLPSAKVASTFRGMQGQECLIKPVEIEVIARSEQSK